MCCLNGVFFHTVFYFLVFLLTIAPCQCHESQTNYTCAPIRCSPSGPEIRFPFGIEGPKRCSYPGFEMSCKGNRSVLLLPSTTEEVVVRHIDYNSQILEVDSNGFFPGLLFHLNLSLSSFNYDCIYKRSNYTFINCSPGVKVVMGIYWFEVPKVDCMGDSKHDVFIVDSYASLDYVPTFCQFMKNVKEVPSYDLWTKDEGLGGGYLKDHFIRLRWEMPRGCIGCDAAEVGRSSLKDKAHNSGTECFSSHPDGNSTFRIIIGCSIAGFFVSVATVFGIIYYSWRLEREKDIENQLKVEKFLKEYKSLTPTRYSHADLKRMTDRFKEKLGQGAYGSVYKGKLDNGILVAVKILHKSTEDAQDFVNEVSTIGRIHHINVVRLLGFCTEYFKRALIYEFMPNESLEKFIFSTQSKNSLLSWEKLRDIAIGIARGIEYLHLECDQRILHFDIKPHNVLLDQNFIPKISDFGFAKLCSKGQSIVSMTAARGTIGYIAPEVLSRNFGNVSYKSDIYSFGMLLLEMVGGRKNIDVTVENTSQVYFPEWIYNRLHHGEDLGLYSASNEDSDIAKKLTIVALWCIQWCPVDRPSVKTVVQMLEGSFESLTMPPNPFVSSAPSNVETAPREELQATILEIIEELDEEKESDLY